MLDVIIPGRGDGQEIRSGPPSYFLLPSFTLLRGFPLISFPFSHLPSSLKRSGELNTSVGSSDRCHTPPPPPSFSSSLCPPSVLPISPPPVLQVSQIHRNSQRQGKTNLLDKERKKNHVESQIFLSHYSLFNRAAFFFSLPFSHTYKNVKKKWNVFLLGLYLCYLYVYHSEVCQMYRGPRCKFTSPWVTVDLANSSKPQIPARWFASLCIFSVPLLKPGFPFLSPQTPH